MVLLLSWLTALALTIATIAGDTETCTGQNEIYSHGYDPCPPQTCESHIRGVVCTAVLRPLQFGCRCTSGFHRNSDNVCVSEEECYKNRQRRSPDTPLRKPIKCIKPNEYYACDSACDNECSTIQTQSRINCPIQNIVCNNKCYCKDGYARDSQQNCIPVEQC